MHPRLLPVQLHKAKENIVKNVREWCSVYLSMLRLRQNDINTKERSFHISGPTIERLWRSATSHSRYRATKAPSSRQARSPTGIARPTLKILIGCAVKQAADGANSETHRRMGGGEQSAPQKIREFVVFGRIRRLSEYTSFHFSQTRGYWLSLSATAYVGYEIEQRSVD